MPTAFPQFRKSSNGANYYRIDGPDRFEELQLIGARVVRHVVEARSYPEKVRVIELLEGAGGAFLPIGEADFLAVAGRLTR